MTLDHIIAQHRKAVAAINYENASSQAVDKERAIAHMVVHHRPATLDEVRQLARHALGEDLTAEDKAELFRTLSA
ncbi:hypothetical protein [Mesorhizobium denitrificans]|uniref:Uncharacterized protein n=1 Tax=Mesorhizobium denitrificans TaxID=2294114 RepID=A0A371XDR8_9HYPH|nr:hypothetical protein [Mesorhizobium denitrificans]RFC67377.1 hypothetical protein DY251_12630 [Mesorhizobium denitrificans]